MVMNAAASLELLMDESTNVVIATVEDLGAESFAEQDLSAIHEYLVDLARDEAGDYRARIAAINALTRFPDERMSALAALFECVRDFDSDVHDAAVSRLEQLCPAEQELNGELREAITNQDAQSVRGLVHIASKTLRESTALTNTLTDGLALAAPRGWNTLLVLGLRDLCPQLKLSDLVQKLVEHHAHDVQEVSSFIAECRARLVPATVASYRSAEPDSPDSQPFSQADLRVDIPDLSAALLVQIFRQSGDSADMLCAQLGRIVRSKRDPFCRKEALRAFCDLMETGTSEEICCALETVGPLERLAATLLPTIDKLRNHPVREVRLAARKAHCVVKSAWIPERL